MCGFFPDGNVGSGALFVLTTVSFTGARRRATSHGTQNTHEVGTRMCVPCKPLYAGFTHKLSLGNVKDVKKRETNGKDSMADRVPPLLHQNMVNLWFSDHKITQFVISV